MNLSFKFVDSFLRRFIFVNTNIRTNLSFVTTFSWPPKKIQVLSVKLENGIWKKFVYTSFFFLSIELRNTLFSIGTIHLVTNVTTFSWPKKKYNFGQLKLEMASKNLFLHKFLLLVSWIKKGRGYWPGHCPGQ